MKLALSLIITGLLCVSLHAAEPEKKPDAAPAKPVLKIIPGQVIVPTDAMRRPWGELISVDLATRTGKFRNESNDEVMSFTACRMPRCCTMRRSATCPISRSASA